MIKIPKGNILACDTECTGLNPWKGARPFAISFCNEEGQTGFIRFMVDRKTRKVFVPEKTKYLLCRLFSDTEKRFVFHNAKFDIRMLESIGLPKPRNIEETMFAMHMVNSLEPSFKLKTIGAKHLGINTDDERALRKSVAAARRHARAHQWVIGKDVDHDYWFADPAILETYSRLDAERTMLLWMWLRDTMEEMKVLDSYNREMKLWNVTYEMETRGVRIDLPRTIKEQNNCKSKIRQHEMKIKQLAPGVNIRSNKQLAHFFFEKEDLPVTERTATGSPSVKAAVLKKLDHPLAEHIMKLKSADKALTTYFEKFEELSVKEPDGWIIHPNFQQVGPVTGRYSCREPNLQNVADAKTSRSYVPFQARQVFIPRKECAWLHADYSQLEARIFADVSQETFMLDVFKLGRDLHAETANRIWGGAGNKEAFIVAAEALGLGPSWEGLKVRDFLEKWNWDIVKAEASLGKKVSRTKAKTLLYLKIYGGAAPAAAEVMGCSEAEAAVSLRDYDLAFPRIRKYSFELIKQAREEGCIWDAYGRRLSIDPNNAFVAVNYKVQGSAASLIKDRMLALWLWLKSVSSLDATLILTIHDEVVIEIKKGHLRYWVLSKIKRIMEDHGGRFGVSLPVDFKVTWERWSEAKGVDYGGKEGAKGV